MSEPQSNNWMTESLTVFVTHPEISVPKWLLPRKFGNYVNWLICPTWAGKLVIPTPAKKSSWFSVSCLWEGLISFPIEAVSVLVTPHSYHAHSRKWELPVGDSSAPSLMSAGEQNESRSRTPISPRELCSISRWVAHLIDADLADVYIWSELSLLSLTSFWGYKFV